MAETVQLYVRVPRETAEMIRQLADENDRSVSAEIARALRLYVTGEGRVQA